MRVLSYAKTVPRSFIVATKLFNLMAHQAGLTGFKKDYAYDMMVKEMNKISEGERMERLWEIKRLMNSEIM